MYPEEIVRRQVFRRALLQELRMRNLLTGFGLCIALGAAAPLLAQSPDPSVYEKDAASTNKHLTVAQERIYERAAFEARERMARIESRHRNGITLSRPAIATGTSLVPDTLFTGAWHYYRGPQFPTP
jgi:hypothetical protein